MPTNDTLNYSDGETVNIIIMILWIPVSHCLDIQLYSKLYGASRKHTTIN